jgi:hypothetical protein
MRDQARPPKGGNTAELMVGELVLEGDGEPDWLEYAKEAYRVSTDYWDNSLTSRLEKNIQLFNNRHPSGSKYHTDAYKYRAKGFRPKTRSAITRGEAQAAIAFFSTGDAVNIEAQNTNDPSQRLAADLNREILDYRLRNTIPWFLTLVGGFQDASVSGLVCSKQYWEYEEQDIDGLDGSKTTRTVLDRPWIDLIPLENIRFDPNADWRDLVQSSPYFINMVPMYVDDIQDKIDNGDWDEPEGGITGLVNDGQKDGVRAVRQARAGSGRQDPRDTSEESTHFKILWVHENFIRIKGTDYVYFTLGTDHLLSEPVPLKEHPNYQHGMRPFTIGFVSLETHKTPPSGLPELWEGMQTEINELSNQRRDNVNLVLNTRYFVNRNGNVDTRLLKASIPGATVLMDDINADVKADRPADVTASSFQEQNLLNVGFDEIAGAFSPGSVQTNRNLNETVGGMEMLSNDSNSIHEYRLRIFVETWVEPTLRQLVALEQAYETDEIILNVAGQQSSIFKQLNIPRVYDWMLSGPMRTEVNVGLGNSNPMQRIEKLNAAFGALSQVMMIPGVDLKEVRAEIFGAVGHKDGSRFFSEEGEQDPRIAQLEQQVQELTAQLQGKQAEVQGRVQVAQIQAQSRTQSEQMRAQTQLRIKELEMSIKQVDTQLQGARLKSENELQVADLQNRRDALMYQMRLESAKLLQQNQRDSMAQTLKNDRYGLLPGGKG